MAQLSKVLKVVCWAGSGLVPNMLLASEDIKQKQNVRQRPFSPSVSAEAGCLFTVAADVHVFISGESL